MSRSLLCKAAAYRETHIACHAKVFTPAWQIARFGSGLVGAAFSGFVHGSGEAQQAECVLRLGAARGLRRQNRIGSALHRRDDLCIIGRAGRPGPFAVGEQLIAVAADGQIDGRAGRERIAAGERHFTFTLLLGR